MARGFESKMVEFQQEEAARGGPKGEPVSAEIREFLARRASLELARVRVVDDLSRATRPAHKAMLEQAIQALEAQLQALQPPRL